MFPLAQMYRPSKFFNFSRKGREFHAPCLAPTLRQCLASKIARSRLPRHAQSGKQIWGHSEGTLFFIELSSAAEPYFAQLIKLYGPLPGLARVFQHAITPGMVDESDLNVLFPPDRFTLLGTGQSHIHIVHTLSTGEVVIVPAFHAVLRRRQN